MPRAVLWTEIWATSILKKHNVLEAICNRPHLREIVTKKRHDKEHEVDIAHLEHAIVILRIANQNILAKYGLEEKDVANNPYEAKSIVENLRAQKHDADDLAGVIPFVEGYVKDGNLTIQDFG